MNLSPLFRQRFFDDNGVMLSGGQIFTYAAGTTTPQGTYSNATGTTNTNPVVLDAYGYADVWLDPTLAYKIVLEDANNNVLWTVDNVTFAVGLTTWNANTVYSAGSIVEDTSGTGMLYVSLTNSNQNNLLTSVSNWRVFQGNLRTVSSSQTSPTLLVTDDLVRSNSTSGNLTHTLPPCSTTPVGKKITVKDVGTGGYHTSVKGSGTDQVDGNVTFSTSLTQYNLVTFENTGSAWDSSISAIPNGAITAAKIASGAFLAPTVQSLTSGTAATYTTPTSPVPLYIRVKMVGGGGGGGGTSSSAGGAGGATTFGSSLLTCNGGAAGATSGAGGGGGAGAAATIGAGAYGLAQYGATGGTGPDCAGTNGGTGGCSPFGGSAPAGAGAISNSGSGGGGASQSNVSGGGGGGSGSYIDAFIVAPGTTYTYTIGAGGTAGTGGGTGGTGYILVEEHYQ